MAEQAPPETVAEVLASLAQLRRESAQIVAKAQFHVPRKERREMVRRFEALRKQGAAISPRVEALLATATDAATRERLEKDVYFLEQLRTFQLLQGQTESEA
jgi:hypothetical protein